MAVLAVAAPRVPALRTDQPDTYVEIGRIFCVGRNYAEHAREMGHDPDAEPPFFFDKPVSSIVPSGATLPFPMATTNLHHEAELAVLLGHCGTGIDRDRAMDLIWGYASANDLTRRDLQAEAKKKARPWDMAKGFDQSCILGTVHKGPLEALETRAIRCTVDDDVRQDAKLGDMIWPLPDIIAHLSRFVTLQPGDLILTGTPAGVGPIRPGQTCKVEIDGLDPAIVSYSG